jgi:thiamine biosynthesis lipoprotein
MFAILFTGCNTKPATDAKNEGDDYLSKSSFLLNTIVTITLYDKQDESLINSVFDLITEYENIYSRTLEHSELYALNNNTAPHTGKIYEISDEMASILTYGLHYSELSKGAFDITIGSVSSLWDFKSVNPFVPAAEDITEALAYVDYKNVKLQGNQLTYEKEGIKLDFGAIAKGYIADRVKEFLISQGVKSAMINLGGNVLCVGNKPDGTPFKVGIQKPFADRNETIAMIKISDYSVVSSGVYERYITVNGKNYHHILNPKTGYSYDNDLVSVTIISKRSVDGDGLSTSCFALGLEDGLALINSLPDTYAVFITKDYEVYYSEGLTENFEIIQ